MKKSPPSSSPQSLLHVRNRKLYTDYTITYLVQIASVFFGDRRRSNVQSKDGDKNMKWGQEVQGMRCQNVLLIDGNACLHNYYDVRLHDTYVVALRSSKLRVTS